MHFPKFLHGKSNMDYHNNMSFEMGLYVRFSNINHSRVYNFTLDDENDPKVLHNLLDKDMQMRDISQANTSH